MEWDNQRECILPSSPSFFIVGRSWTDVGPPTRPWDSQNMRWFDRIQDFDLNIKLEFQLCPMVLITFQHLFFINLDHKKTQLSELKCRRSWFHQIPQAASYLSNFCINPEAHYHLQAVSLYHWTFITFRWSRCLLSNLISYVLLFFQN